MTWGFRVSIVTDWTDSKNNKNGVRRGKASIVAPGPETNRVWGVCFFVGGVFFFFFFFFFDPNRDTGKDRDQGNQTTWGNALLFSCFCFQDTKGEELALVCSFQPSVLCLHPSSRSFLLPPCFTSAWTSILLSFCTALLCSETLFVYLSLCPCIVLSSILFSFPYRL